MWGFEFAPSFCFVFEGRCGPEGPAGAGVRGVFRLAEGAKAQVRKSWFLLGNAAAPPPPTGHPCS